MGIQSFDINKVYALIDAYKQGILGGEKMPEDENPVLDKSSKENYLYFTLPMALNYQRNSYTLWECANKTYKEMDTTDVFDTKAVVTMDEQILREKLVKYKVALQPNKQPIIWRTICETVENEFKGDIRLLFSENDYSVKRIKEYIAKNKKKFPYLGGNKICNYWLYVMEQYTDVREVVSNILAHRDYANAYTAQFVIERDKLYTKNSNLPHGHGELELNKFEPFPKNPPISKVFREIGYADELGSGMRNTNKYTKLYSGGVPKFVEENTFEIIIPIENVPELRVGGNGTQDGTQDGTQQRILELVDENPKITRKTMAEKLNISVRTLQRVLNEIPNLHYVGTGVNGHWQIEKEQDDVSTN